MTVIVAVPLLPPLVAVMVAEPVATPLASPPPLTVATDEFELPHVTVRPVKALPFASLGVATNCTVWPTDTLADAGLTLTEATGMIVTVIVAGPALPSLVAVMVAEPAATPLTSPLPLTVATDEFELPHVTVRPVRAIPFPSWGVATNCSVWPTNTLPDAGLTLTEATGTLVTVTLAVPVLPSLVAVIVPVPAATPVTKPVAATVITALLLLVQVTARPFSTLPAGSVATAASWRVAPACTLDVAGLTATEATGTLDTVSATVALCPSLVAVSVADPTTSADTNPLELTAATPRLLLVHVTARPLSTLPVASVVVAASCTVWPTVTLADVGETDTAATGTAVTVTVAVSDTPLGWPLAMTFTLPVSAAAL